MTTSNAFTILLAEDDDGHARLIQKNLQRVEDLNYQFIRFRNGTETLEYLRRLQPCSGATDSRLILILDLRMPGMDGLTVLERLKQGQHTQSIPIIVLSTSRIAAEIQRCYELGCNAFVSKPVDYTQFTRSIVKLVNFLSIIEFPEFCVR